MKRRLLSLSTNPELAKLRSMVLRQAGFHVTWPSTREEADRILNQENFDLLLIGHTISGESARHFAEVFRAKNPKGRSSQSRRQRT
jgi:DNA-binding response OmpR family regulator